jgi:hypothetical protein
VLNEDPAAGQTVAAVVLEHARVDEFGVEAAVPGVVGLLAHDAVESGADVGGGVRGVDGEGDGLGKDWESKGGESSGEEGMSGKGAMHECPEI